MTKEELNSYAMRISQASKTQIIVIMYEVAIKYIEDACDAFKKQDYVLYRNCLSRAKAFVNELASALNLQYEVSANLLSLYSFFNKAIIRADIRLNTDELIRVKKMLLSLKEAFEEVSHSDKSEPVMMNVQRVYTGLTYSKNSLNDNFGNIEDINRGYKI